MTVEQRKIALINLISTTNNESLLIKMEELIQSSSSDTPDSILRLLALSDKSKSVKAYSSAKEILK